MNNSIVVGCDIGGSHISAALVDLDKKTLIKETFVRQSVNSNEGVSSIIDAWSNCITNTLKKGAIEKTAVGIAIPGPFDYEHGISLMKNQNKYEALYGVDVKELLAKKLGITSSQLTFMNDAACFLQGEMFAGAGTTFTRSVGLTLGTGLGSALYLNGHAVDGDLWCAAFRDGIAEDYLSGSWLKNSYLARTGRNVEHVKALCELVPADGQAEALLREFGRTLGEFVVEHLLDDKPDGLILGGNIAKAHPLFLSETKKVLAQQEQELPIKIAELGEMAAIYGAAGALK
ncbi:ROK family protein [Olivibacter sp. SDN3]|uniref:ROK family protein n=1 Tax=Olivibacter sp. SDN3 TaxID=2764720 RepID=UPI001651457D|nr:ROK family protein [Olivibacter sp. SDN3]QNL50678.1 ROK family protein [Olivibacter sp. SDN3]